MGRTLPTLSKRIHLAVTDSVGGTTMALQYARMTIIEGGRVLWASETMPDGERFSQIFAEVDLVSSSRFHALELGTNMERGVEQIIEASNFLPNVTLIVVDDWAPKQGRTPENTITLIENALKKSPDYCSVLLTSKSYSSPTGDGAVRIRAKERLEEFGCETWILSRLKQNSSKRNLSTSETEFEFDLTEDGFV